jgi:hypothetical protein
MRQPVRAAALLITLCGSLAHAGEIQVPEAPAAPGFALPPPDGPHPVGVRSYGWIDEERPELATPDEGDFREVTVQIWYPAAAGTDEAKALYAPDMETILAASADLPTREQGFVRAHTPLLDTATNSVPGAKPAPSDRPWPVILFSPGGNVSRHFQTALAERMASQGFVFVSMSHPYSTIDVAPHSGFSMSIDWGLDAEDAETARANDDRMANVLAADARFVIERLGQLASSDGPFAGALELDHLGIAGHSRGGTTVGRSCTADPRFVACAVLDNIGPDREQETGVPTPFLTLRSPWDDERIAALHDYLGRTGSVAHDVELSDSNHFTCTDLPLFLSDLRVEGVEPADGIGKCAKILTSFFDAYLRRRISTHDMWQRSIDSAKVTRFERRKQRE